MSQFITRPFDPQIAQRLRDEGIPHALARVYAARGVLSRRELNYDLRNMLSPFSMKGIEEATERLLSAWQNKEHIVIVADYDCDGATACALGIRAFRRLGFTVNYFVPDRIRHGYGLSRLIVQRIIERDPKTTLIVTVDNGINSVDAVQFAKENGIDVIVTDHHLPGEVLPQACAICNPNQPGCPFPSKNLAGVGVLFYVLIALRSKMRQAHCFDQQAEPNLAQYIDLVALGTVADLVRLDPNNRLLVAAGLQRLRQGRTIPGIAQLYNVSRRDMLQAQANDFGFALGPRINAAGRLESMTVGIECLLSENYPEAHALATRLHDINSERRKVQREMQERAKRLVDGLNVDRLHPQIGYVLYDKNFNEGIVGLIASRLKEKWHRPVLVFAPSSEPHILKGSGRSIPGLHLRDLLAHVQQVAPDLIVKFGGHAMAAGLSIPSDRFEEFQKIFLELLQTYLTEDLLEHKIYVDGPLQARDLTFSLCQAIENEVWGQGFNEPTYLNEFTIKSQQILKDAHLKLTVELNGRRFSAIYFGYNRPLPERVRLAYVPTINTYQHKQSIQLRIIGVDSNN